MQKIALIDYFSFSSFDFSLPGTFCTERPNGQYRNPWTCHEFISCSNSQSHYMGCHPSSLVYNPTTNQCDWPRSMKCKQIPSHAETTTVPPTTSPVNRCTDKKDGLYVLGDVFKYLECKAGTEIVHSCPVDQIYSPKIMKCKTPTNEDKKTFCDSRPTGHYRNPWNCHHFFICSNKFAHDMMCHPISLVYDPDNVQCEWPSKMPCKQVPGACNPLFLFKLQISFMDFS